jgi:hypothetical protein
MSDDLPPYQGQNWLCLTDAELREIVTAVVPPNWFLKKAYLALAALDKRLTERAKLAEAIPSHVRTDRGGLET